MESPCTPIWSFSAIVAGIAKAHAPVSFAINFSARLAHKSRCLSLPSTGFVPCRSVPVLHSEKDQLTIPTMASALKPGDIVTAFSPKSDKHGIKGWYTKQKKRVSVCCPGNTTRHFAPKNVVKYEGDSVEEITSCEEYQEFMKQQDRGGGDAPASDPPLSMEQLAEAILGVADEQEGQAGELKIQATVMKGLVSQFQELDQVLGRNFRLLCNLNERLADYDLDPPVAVPARRARQKNLAAALIEE